MLRALALGLLLVAAPTLAAETADSPLVCGSPELAEALGPLCAPVQLAQNANCAQTCYQDQNACHSGCDKTYRGGAPGHDKCMAACSTTYGRCQMRCNAPQRSPRPSE